MQVYQNNQLPLSFVRSVVHSSLLKIQQPSRPTHLPTPHHSPLHSTLDPQMIHPLPSTQGLRLRRGLRHLPALCLLAALLCRRSCMCIRIGAGSSLRRRCKHTSAKLLPDESLPDNADVGRRNSFGGCVDRWIGKGRGGGGGYLPWSCLNSTLVDEPSALVCVVFLLVLERAPERAPKRLRLRPP